jgi:hypothetical protein
MAYAHPAPDLRGCEFLTQDTKVGSISAALELTHSGRVDPPKLVVGNHTLPLSNIQLNGASYRIHFRIVVFVHS